MNEFLMYFDNISILFEYFVPGYLLLCLFHYFTSRQMHNITIPAIVISYILRSVCIICKHMLNIKHCFSWYQRCLILSIFAIVLSLIIVSIIYNKIFMKIFFKISGRTIHESIVDNVSPGANACHMCAVIGDLKYYGYIKYREENGDDSWWCLGDYIITDMEDNEISSRKIDNSFICLKEKDFKYYYLFPE